MTEEVIKPVKDIAKEITLLLYDTGMIRTWLRDRPGGWKLRSGIWSPFYIQLRTICSHPNSQEILRKVGDAMGRMIRDRIPETTRIVGVALAGIPLAVAITMCTGIPSCYTRSIMDVKDLKSLEKAIKKLAKKHGEPTLAEGEFVDGDILVIVDDLVTDFQSKLIAKALVDFETNRRKVKVTCENVAVLFDREQGAASNAKLFGMNLFSLIPFKSKGMGWLKERMSAKEYEIILDYLERPENYQDPTVQKDLEAFAKEAEYEKGP